LNYLAGFKAQSNIYSLLLPDIKHHEAVIWGFAILTEVFNGFPHFLYRNAGILPLI
jgi:hypothetical protein